MLGITMTSVQAEDPYTCPPPPLVKRVIGSGPGSCVDVYGSLEKVKLLHFLSQYPVTPYTYRIDGHLSRGSRPSQAK